MSGPACSGHLFAQVFDEILDLADEVFFSILGNTDRRTSRYDTRNSARGGLIGLAAPWTGLVHPVLVVQLVFQRDCTSLLLRVLMSFKHASEPCLYSAVRLYSAVEGVL